MGREVMPTEMEERVARALLLADCGPEWETVNESVKNYFVALARAAIKALREPTEAMRDAEQSLYVGDGVYAGDVWTAMIDAATSVEPE